MVGDQHGDPSGMIVLCTDFGLEGPYTGQVKAVLARAAPAVPVIDLFADLPPFRPQAAAYLLAAYGEVFVAGDVIVAVVDPGVGGARAALALEADGRWYVGPDNGIFELVLRRAQAARCWRIDWRPAALSATFHGRDLFAPVAAGLARGEPPPGKRRRPDAPPGLAGRPGRDRLCRSLRQCHDRPAGGSAASRHGTRGRGRAHPPGRAPSATCRPAPSCGTPTPTGSPKSRPAAPARRRSWTRAGHPGGGAYARLTVVTPSRPAYVRAHSWGVAKR